jgi:hypothetical protein
MVQGKEAQYPIIIEIIRIVWGGVKEEVEGKKSE